jgi:hypothetical protein
MNSETTANRRGRRDGQEQCCCAHTAYHLSQMTSGPGTWVDEPLISPSLVSPFWCADAVRGASLEQEFRAFRRPPVRIEPPRFTGIY